MLGLKHGVNRLVDYDPEWPAAFEHERTRIRALVGDVARGIEHYGSTAVEGLRAKPIIDILVGVAPLDEWIKCKRPLESLGYDYAENAGVPGHFVFGRGRDQTERTHLVHIVEFGGDAWRSSLAFRDALRADESLRAAYLRVKERAVSLAPEGRAGYNRLKHSFFEPQPPFLVIRERQAFWVQKTPAHAASATLQAFEEGCYRHAYCYDATGGLWPIVNATLHESPSLSERAMPWRQVAVRLECGPRTDVPVEDVVSRLARVLRDDNEFCRFSAAPAAVLGRFGSARTPGEIIQVALEYE